MVTTRSMAAPSSIPALGTYSIVLKIQGLIFGTIFPFGYFLKFGVAWHDAGQPFNLFDVKFHPYWNMILVIYTGIGAFLFMASYDIVKYKIFLSFCTWVAFFAHGCTATVAVLTSDTPNYVGPGLFGEYYPETYFGLKNGDKVLALAIWFGDFAVSLYFAYKVFGDANLPWNLFSKGTASLPTYSIVLKIQGLIFGTIFPFGYFLKFGVAWHDAGQPFNLFDVKFHPYWNMILVIYTGIGAFLFMASYDIVKYKIFLSFCTWVAFFAHGCTATVAVLTSDTPNYVGPGLFGEYYPETYFGLKNGDKVLALAIWFGDFAVSLYFAYKVFGDANLPWNLDGGKAKVSPPTSGRSDKSDDALLGGKKSLW